MSLPTVRFYYDRKKKATPTKASYIEIEVNYERRHRYFSTGVKVLPNQWDGSQVVRHPQSIAANATLSKRLQQIKEAINLIYIRGEDFSLSGIVITKKGADPGGNFLTYLENKITTRKDITPITARTQMKLVTALNEFKSNVSFAELTRRFVRAFDEWLHGRDLKQTSVFCYHKILKTYVKFAMEEGLLVEDPYQGLKFDKGKSSTRKYLEQEEIEAIENLKVDNDSVMNARDLFLFQCYTGLAYVDLASIKLEGMRMVGGKYVIKGNRHKTGTNFHVVLLKPAVEILERHNFKLPIISNQKYNLFLKAVAAHAGLNFNLTSHCGRHTFATWCLNNGVEISTLKEMLGHTHTSTTEIYGKLLAKTVRGAFDRLDEKFS